MTVMDKLAQLGLTLPAVAKPLAAYVPAVRVGNLVFTSGQIPFVNGELMLKGRVGAEVSVEQGYQAAQTCALNGLAALTTVVDLDQVKRVVKLTGFVCSAGDFYDQAKVVNGASELLIQLFGEAGRHARSAVGLYALPLNSPVEIEMIFEVAD